MKATSRRKFIAVNRHHCVCYAWVETMKSPRRILSSITLALIIVATANAQVTFDGSHFYIGCPSDVDVIGGLPGPLSAGTHYLTGTLTITNGGTLTDGGGQVGYFGGDGTWAEIGTGNVLVDGAGSTWENTGPCFATCGTGSGGCSPGGITLGAGRAGTSGFLTIQNGGTVHSHGQCIVGIGPGDNSDGSYGSVTVDGLGSIWTIEHDAAGGGPLRIGYFGAGYGQLTIRNGGVVLDNGSGAGGNGGVSMQSSPLGSSSIVVDGLGSSLITSNQLSIADFNNTAPASTMTTRNGGSVRDHDAVLQHATALVDGNGSTSSNASGALLIGNAGPSASLTIQNGGRVYNATGTSISEGSQLTVNGTGSVLITSNLSINGGVGTNSVVVQNGGSIQCFNGGLDLEGGNIMTIDGSNSSVVCSNDIYGISVFGTLTLRNGGVLTSTAGTILVQWLPFYGRFGVVRGTGVVNGNLDVSGMLTPGEGAGGIGTLTINGDLNWGSGSSMTANFDLGSNSDQIVVSSNLNLNGTVNITTNAGFGTGAYTLFTYGGALTMGAASISQPPAGLSYSINTNTPGKVNLIVDLNPARFTSINKTGSNVVCSGKSGFPNQNYYVITSTDLTVPMSQWPAVATNQFDSSGNFVFTNAVGNESQRFYSVAVP